MRTIIRYVLLTALRDRLFLVLILGLLIAAGLASALANTSLVEIEQMRVVFTAGVARIILIIGMIVFVAFHVRSAFDSREIDVILSRPISRATLVLAYWTGFAVVATCLTLCSALIVYLTGSQALTPGFGLWALSLMLESWLIIAIALFTSLLIRSAVANVMVCLGFYALARMMGYFLITIQSRLLFTDHYSNLAAKWSVKGISLFVPRLDFFAETSWLVYAVDNLSHSLMLFGTQALVYTPLLLLAAIVDFRKKQF